MIIHNIEEGLMVVAILPLKHWQRLRTSNMAERVSKEVKRRTRISGLFPNTNSYLRLVSAVLVDIDELWTMQWSICISTNKIK